MKFIIKKTFPLLFILITVQIALSQKTETIFDKKYFKYNHYIDLNFSSNLDVYNINKTWFRLHTINKGKKRKSAGSIFNSNRFHLGYGLRVGGMIGQNMNYQDKINIDLGENIYLNTGFYMLFNFTNNFALGINTDLAGFSTGGKRFAQIQSVDGKKSNNPTENVISVNPSNGNLILQSGLINSNAFISYWFTDKLYLKLGYNRLTSEYLFKNVSNPAENENFRKTIHLPMLSLGYCGSRVEVFSK